MILSVHIADVGARTAAMLILRRPDLTQPPGLFHSEMMLAAPLSEQLLPAPQLGRVGLIAAWREDAALDRFLASHPLAARLASGWHARLQPLRVYGSWPGLAGLPSREVAVAEAEPVAVLTLGRLRLRRSLAFLRASSRAEAQALAEPALLAATGLARPHRAVVCTFSLWRSALEMSDYARGRLDGAHPTAVAAHRDRPFHHESAFIRLRPYASGGSWDGREPLAAASPRSDEQP